LIRARSGAALAICLTAVVAAREPALAAAGAAGAAEASVTYVTSATVYVGCGTEAGLGKGDVLKVFRGDEFVTALEVSAVSSRRASCSRTDDGAEIRVGDRVRFFPAGSDPAPAPAAVAAAAPVSPLSRPSLGSWLRGRGMRGRVGLRYLGVREGDGDGGTYRQPALDVRLEGSPPAAPAVRFSADVRSRRTYRSWGSESSEVGRTRVYRLLGEWKVGRGFQTVGGRQYFTALTAVGIFDGLSVEYSGDAWSAGAFSGFQPDIATFGLSTDVVEHGTYVAWRSHAAAPAWQLTAGAIGSYEDGAINRENLVVQARFRGGRIAASATQDIDVNRGWKRRTGAPPLALTSSFLSVRYEVRESVSVDGGFDDRRSVRLYRDRVTPETEFDDNARQGVWAGLQLRPGRRSRMGVNVRDTRGGPGGTARSVTLTASTSLSPRHEATAGVRSTAYRSEVERGWLHSATTGLALGPAHLELNGGLRREAANGLVPAEEVFWWGADTELRLSGAWMLLLSTEASRSDLGRSSQVYLNAIYRF
jgi:hypothetical protein